MRMLPKMSPLRIFSGLSILFLAHLAKCSLHDHNEDGIPRNNTISQVNSRKTFDIVVHGIILWTSMGFLVPVGILTMRMYASTGDCQQTRHKISFYHLHATLQRCFLSYLLLGAVLSIRKFENAFNNSHQRIGLALYAAV